VRKLYAEKSKDMLQQQKRDEDKTADLWWESGILLAQDRFIAIIALP